MVLNKKYFSVFFSTFFSLVVFSQKIIKTKQDSTAIESLDEVIVTATRTQRQLSSIPLPAQIISKKEIININSIRLSDILNEQTGLITVPDFGGGEGIQLQGLDSQYTLILIDGVPLVGRSAGTLDLSRVSVGNIKQIELVKGASSALYGNEALGGVINIITEKPKVGFKGDINYRSALNTNDFDTSNDISANINYKKEKLGITAFFNRFSSNGYDLDEDTTFKTVEPFINYTLSTKVNYDVSKKTSILFSGRYYHQLQDYIATETLGGESELNEWNTLLRVQHKFTSKWNSYFEFYATQYKAEEYLNDENGVLNSQSNFNQYYIRPEFRATYTFDTNNNLVAGVGLTNERLDRTYFTLTPEFHAPYIYAQYDGQIIDNVNLILGARFDNHNKYKSQFSPKIALRYKINDKISVKASSGYGFKAPDFRQLYFDFTNSTVGYTVLGYNEVPRRLQELFDNGELVNATTQENITQIINQFESSLNPESSISYNFGIDYKLFSSLKLNLNIFRNDIKNLIDTRVVTQKESGQNVFSYYNVDKVYTQGLEFNAHLKINKNIAVSGGYQLLYAYDKEAENAFRNGEVYARDLETLSTFSLEKDDYFGLYNRSRHMANFKIFYDIPEWNLNANLRGTYRSKYGLFDSNANAYLDNYDAFVNGYSIWDFAINKTFDKKYQLSFGVDNLFNFTDTQNISNIAGSIMYTKINIQF
ncbi:TonB-dependent receptor [uncultured Polaribacter sp.]|uniref:TonB-dependent receptor plug domain-containing protein n=1 Tax=uncultured Polaribacter sp. TaxID=174711 RepID=UPI002616C4A9|nr:TonB-dependent receptor [uncultured Polaribacter sp.]